MTKKVNSARFSLDETIASTKFNFTKNFLWFLIPVVAIIIVGVILLSTIGFNLTTDFTGGSIIKIYANYEKTIENAESYNLENSGDFNKLKDEVEKVFAQNNISNVSYQTTTIDIAELGVYHGQAMMIKYQNSKDASYEQILTTNSKLQDEITNALNFSDTPEAVINGGITTPSASNELIVNSFLAIILTMILVAIYMLLRFGVAPACATLLTMFIDILVVASLVLIFRLPLSANIVAGIITIICFSACNNIITFSKIKESQKSGKFDGISNETLANTSIKETLSRSIITTFVAVICLILLSIIGVGDIRILAIIISLGILSSFYSSIFIATGLWTISFKPKKKIKTDVDAQNLLEKAS